MDKEREGLPTHCRANEGERTGLPLSEMRKHGLHKPNCTNKIGIKHVLGEGVAE